MEFNISVKSALFWVSLAKTIATLAVVIVLVTNYELFIGAFESAEPEVVGLLLWAFILIYTLQFLSVPIRRSEE